MKSDLHIHTFFSGDSETPMEAMIQEGIRKELHTMCFTEHLDLDYPPIDVDFNLDLDAYHNLFLQYKEKYASEIELLFGMEFGMQPHLSRKCQELADAYPFDMIIASQHLLAGQDPYYPEVWEGKDAFTMICSYYKEMLNNLKHMTAYDTLGHLDYIVRYSGSEKDSYTYKKYADYIDPILLHLIQNGKALEVNTAGLKYGMGQPNPNCDTLLRYQELGGELITVGSDGHVPEHLAYNFPIISDFLKNIGFKYHFIYRQRNAEAQKL